MTTQSTEIFSEISVPTNPFPGLRPFEFDESHLFFGREGQSESLIEKLGRTHFLAVVGTSGSGKSSLVRAGLLPALLGGFMTSAGSNWRIAIMRPGNDPIGNLARALNEPDVFGSEIAENVALQTALAEATLRRGGRGLVDAARQVVAPENENLLLVVDQFEEIFRFDTVTKGEQYQNEVAAFVKLFLEASRQREIPILVVLTMRSEYLGDCSQVWDLPEAINKSQYLIPRLTRDQLREAICGPVAVGAGKITSRLVNRLLNDVGDNQDQLPVLQHLLMRVWDESKKLRLDLEVKEGGETVSRPHREEHKGEAMDLCCYQAVGGMAEALSRHADEAFDELPDDRHRKVAEKLFKALTEKGKDNRETRRPVKLGEICLITEATAAQVGTVIETFRKPTRSFLIPPAGIPLSPDSMIDISHESLIRLWKGNEKQKRLKEWVDEEAESASTYRRLAETAEFRGKGKAGLLGDPDLQVALNWQEQNQPTKEWAQRYHPSFETALGFLQDSKKDRQKRVNLRRLVVTVVVLLFLFSAVAALVAYKSYRDASAAYLSATENERKATRALYASNMNLADKARAVGNFARLNEILEKHIPASGEPDLRGFEWYYLWRLGHDEQATLRGHSGSVYSVSFSPDGSMLATLGDDKAIRLWDVRTSKELTPPLKGHNSPVVSVAISPDGKLLASGGSDGELKLWDLSTRKEIASFAGGTGGGDKGHSGEISCVAFSPIGGLLATASRDKTVKLWKIGAEKMELDGVLQLEDVVYSVAFSPDGARLASSSLDKRVTLWDLKTKASIVKTVNSPVYSVTFSPDGKMLALGGKETIPYLLDVSLGKDAEPLSETGHASRILSVAYSRDGKWLATASFDGAVKVWDIQLRKERLTLRGHSSDVRAVVFSPNGTSLATGSTDGTAKIWDVNKTGNSAPFPGGHTARISSVAFSPDSRLLMTGSIDRLVKLWNLDRAQQQSSLEHEFEVYSMALSPDGRTVATGGSEGRVKLWDVSRPEKTRMFQLDKESMLALAFSPNGEKLAAGSSSGKVHVLNTIAMKEEQNFKGHDAKIFSVAFSPDGRVLATGSDFESKTVKLWDTKNWQELFPSFQPDLSTVTSVAFSAKDGMVAAGSFDREVRLWDAATMKGLFTLKRLPEYVMAVSFSPDSRILAVGSVDGKTTLWDTSTGQELFTLEGNIGVRSIAFSPNGRMLAIGREDGSIKLWVAASKEEVAAQTK